MSDRPQVLVALHDARLRAAMGLALSNVGAEVVVARDGGEALAALEELDYSVDALLLEVDMPRASGLDVLSVARTIRADLPACLVGDADTAALAAGASICTVDALLADPTPALDALLADTVALAG